MDQYPPEALIPASIRAIFLDSFYTPYLQKKRPQMRPFRKLTFVFTLSLTCLRQIPNLRLMRTGESTIAAPLLKKEVLEPAILALQDHIDFYTYGTDS